MRDQFLLDPDVIYLNHGSFGATPRTVFERYQTWQLELEREPVDFIGRRAKDLMQTARDGLAQYFHTQPENLVYMTNVTVALNAAARSLHLGKNDEVLATDQEYGAMDRMWRFLSKQQGFKYINLPINLPVTTPEKYVEEFWRGVTQRTRVIFISHISSPTAVIAPVQEICRKARERGILTIIDGAHVPGQIPLDLEALGADFYGGNLHKWLCAPKGAGFLYAAPRVQSLLEPLVVSIGWESDPPGPSRLVDYYEYMGTRDFSAFLTVPEAIRFQAEHHWDQVRSECHQLASGCLTQMTALTHLEPLYDPASDWFAQMVTIPIPDSLDPQRTRQTLFDRYRIEVPFVTRGGHSLVRVSFQAYNTPRDLVILLDAFQDLLRETNE